MGLPLVVLVESPIHCAEAAVAVRGERADACGSGQACAIVGGAWVDVEATATPGGLSLEATGVRVLAGRRAGAGHLEEESDERAGVVHATDEQQRLAQLGQHERHIEEAGPLTTRSRSWSRSGTAPTVRPAKDYPTVEASGGKERDVVALTERQLRLRAAITPGCSPRRR